MSTNGTRYIFGEQHWNLSPEWKTYLVSFLGTFEFKYNSVELTPKGLRVLNKFPDILTEVSSKVFPDAEPFGSFYSTEPIFYPTKGTLYFKNNVFFVTVYVRGDSLKDVTLVYGDAKNPTSSTKMTLIGRAVQDALHEFAAHIYGGRTRRSPKRSSRSKRSKRSKKLRNFGY
jgi:hypothetical protein